MINRHTLSDLRASIRAEFSKLPHGVLLRGAVLLVALPVWLLHLYRENSPSVLELLPPFGMAYLAFVALCASSSGLHRRWRWIVAGVIATHYVIKAFAVGYEVVAGEAFDPLFFREFHDDLYKGGLKILGPAVLVALVALFLTLWAEFFRTFRRVGECCRQMRSSVRWSASSVAATLLLLAPAARSEVLATLVYADAVLLSSDVMMSPLAPDNSVYKTDSTENVFMLQLESGNALALEGYLTTGGVRYEGDHIPMMRKVAKDGVMFPLHWSNQAPTNRAQESILCGIVRNLRAALSFNPDRLQKECLPAAMVRNGYTSIVFRSDDLGFAHMGEWFRHLGFEEIHNKDIMRPGDKKWDWGYDDCTFYKRAFEYLQDRYPDPEKLFVYFEVSSHHVPFERKPPYRFTHAFPDENNRLEKYINSYLEQDHCVETFYEEYKKYAARNSHLFIHPDHSYMMGEQPGGNERGTWSQQYLVPMTYIPPRSRAHEFRVGATLTRMFSEVDEIPTIFDLLSGKPVGNSFAFALRKNDGNDAHYDSCHVLTHAYQGRSIMVVDGMTYRRYSLRTREMVTYDLKTDLLTEKPIGKPVVMTPDEFQDKYLCDRYQPLLKEDRLKQIEV